MIRFHRIVLAAYDASGCEVLNGSPEPVVIVDWLGHFLRVLRAFLRQSYPFKSSTFLTKFRCIGVFRRQGKFVRDPIARALSTHWKRGDR